MSPIVEDSATHAAQAEHQIMANMEISSSGSLQAKKNAGQRPAFSRCITKDRLLGQQLAQHEWQDTAMLVVINFDRRIDTQQHVDFLRAAVGAVDHQGCQLLWLDFAFEAFQVEGFIAGDAQGLHAVVADELQWQYAHAHQVRAVDTREGTGDHGFYAQQLRTFGRPVARRAGAVLFAAEHHGRRAFSNILHCCVVDRHLFAGRLVDRDAAFDCRTVCLGRDHAVFDTHVGEGAAHHDFMVTATRAVGVEVRFQDAVFLQPLACRAVFLDRTSWRDVVGGDRVAEHAQCARAFDAGGHCRWRHREVVEERWFRDVGRFRPVVDLTGDGGDFFPQLAWCALDVRVVVLEHLGVHGELHHGRHFSRGRPDVAQVDVLAALAFADRFRHQIARHVAGDGVGDDQRWRSEEVRADVRVNTCFEVAVARQHGRRDDVVRGNRCVQLRRQIAGIADTGGAAVGGHAEAQFFQVRQQAGSGQVLGDDARARGQRGLDVRCDFQAGFDGFLGQQAGSQHHARVRGVGARSDRGDQHVAVRHFDVIGGFVHGVQVGRILVETIFARWLGEQFGEVRLDVADFDTVLRAFRAGQRRCDRGQVQFHHAGVVDVAGFWNTVQVLRLEVAFERGDFSLAAAGALEIIDGRVVDREEAHGRAVFRCHVGDRRAVRQGQRFGAYTEEFDELADDFLFAQQFGDGQHQIGGGAAFAQRAGQVHADHVRRQEVHWLAQHARFRLDAAHAPADHADAVDHGGVRVGADQGVRVVHVAGFLACVVHAACQVFQVDLVDDAEAWWHDAEGVECLHAPFHELVTLVVTREFQFHVQVQRFLFAVGIDGHRVVDDQVDRHQRFDFLGVDAHFCSHVTHGGQVGQQWYAGEVLQHDARDYERDLVGALGGRAPARQLLDVFFGDFFAVAVAQYRFQYDANRHRQAGNVDAQAFFQCRQGIQLTLLAI